MAHKASTEANPSSPQLGVMEGGVAAMAFNPHMLQLGPQGLTQRRVISETVRADWNQPFVGISSTDDESGLAPE
jgi:hypothetical protein